MPFTRRNFLATGLAGLAATYGLRPTQAQAPPTPKIPDEDGYKLWLRCSPLGDDARKYATLKSISLPSNSPTARITGQELAAALTRMLARPIPIQDSPTDGSLLIGTPQSSSLLQPLTSQLIPLGTEGYLLRTLHVDNRTILAIASQTDRGVLYGAFHLLRLIQTAQPLDNQTQRPRLQLRLVNHWDNLDGSIERGYAGRSLWNWAELPGKLSSRYTDYARANASIGINGTVLNNVNANARFLSTEYLQKAAALATLWRPYGLRVYLSANFSAPKTLGNLPTADPLDPAVIAWWKAKADEIYTLIPDFGGFLVKANSEGQPGPQDFGRTHAQGANMLADALAPHQGNIIWRAFIYNEDVDPDRAKRAYIEFTALEGQFRPNVLLQVKNGPIDFQPREPFHPLFGALPKTPTIAELQITQEYLGQARHLVYLAPMWKEFLEADTFAKGPGSTVGKVIEGKVHDYPITGMAAVLNTGTDTNWCGHHFSQANWYAFGRLAWDHTLSADAIAAEWIQMTLTRDPAAVQTLQKMMLSSHETFVNYTMPLGLHHLIGGDHYAPMPWNATAQRKDWTAVYYHQAAKNGLGFNRTRAEGGDKAVDQYFAPVASLFNDPATCPEKFLLFFHHLPWDYKLKSALMLWQELCLHYQQGAREAAALQATWATLNTTIDPRRHQEVAQRLATQALHAAQWRDQILQYFQQFSQLPIPLENP